MLIFMLIKSNIKTLKNVTTFIRKSRQARERCGPDGLRGLGVLPLQGLHGRPGLPVPGPGD